MQHLTSILRLDTKSNAMKKITLKKLSGLSAFPVVVKSILNKTIVAALFAALIILNPLHVSAQRNRLHHETMDDTYLPNPYNNQKTSPGYRYDGKSLKQATAASTIFTIQVNVNGSGENIVSDAANEPSIAVNPNNPDEIVIGWRQFDNVGSNFRQGGWSYSSDGGQSWTFPGVLEPGVFRSDPVLDYNSDGTFFYNSLAGNFACKVFISGNGGATWDSGTDIGGGDKQWMAIDRTTGPGSGNIYSSWTTFYSFCQPGFFTRSTNGGAAYNPCTTVDGAPFWVNMCVGVNGELFIAGADTINWGMLVVKSQNAQIQGSVVAWNTPVPVNLDGNFNSGIDANPAGLLGMAYIDVDRSGGPGHGNVYVLASLSRWSNWDPGDVMFSRSIDGGLTWSAAQKINDDVSETNTQWFGTMSVAPNGRIDAVWLDTREDGFWMDISALYYSYSVDQGVTWSANEKLSPEFDPHLGYPNQNKMGDYFDMISHDDYVHLAWANTLNYEQDVYYSRITPGITGVSSVSLNSAVSAFPNPTNGIFNLSVKQWADLRANGLEIYNVFGECIHRQAVSSANCRVDLSKAPAGVYFVKLMSVTKELIFTGKIVIAR